MPSYMSKYDWDGWMDGWGCVVIGTDGWLLW